VIVDSSAIVAVLAREPERIQFATILMSEPVVRMSTATYVELVNVVDRRIGHSALTDLDDFLERVEVELVPFTVTQARWAKHGRVTYGRMGKKGLNFGDCFSYALAKEMDEPLLFKGNDFALTDVKRAV
jgi:ribonuclease VapC